MELNGKNSRGEEEKERKCDILESSPVTVTPREILLWGRGEVD